LHFVIVNPYMLLLVKYDISDTRDHARCEPPFGIVKGDDSITHNEVLQRSREELWMKLCGQKYARLVSGVLQRCNNYVFMLSQRVISSESGRTSRCDEVFG
jgi:hypothetical protein